MSLQQEILFEQSDNTEFVQGFNHASVLAELAPEVLSDISPVHQPQNDYFDGFFCGKAHYRSEMEQQQNQELEALKELRSVSKERDNEREL